MRLLSHEVSMIKLVGSPAYGHLLFVFLPGKTKSRFCVYAAVVIYYEELLFFDSSEVLYCGVYYTVHVHVMIISWVLRYRGSYQLRSRGESENHPEVCCRLFRRHRK